jgi:hypothetical protein
MMGRHQSDGAARQLQVAAVSVLAAVAVGACCAATTQTGAPPDFGIVITNPLDSAQRGAVIRYADTLSFLGIDKEIRGTTDKQVLDSVIISGPDTMFALAGCMGTIMPQEHAYNNEFDALEGPVDSGYGRITVAFRVDSVPGMECLGYETGKLRLPRGLSYLWVGNFTRDSDTSGTVFTAVFPADSSIRAFPDTATVRVCVHEDYQFNHSLARWMFDPADAEAWWTCAKHGCCNGS